MSSQCQKHPNRCEEEELDLDLEGYCFKGGGLDFGVESEFRL